MAQATPGLNGPWVYHGANHDMTHPDEFGPVTQPTSAYTVTVGPEGTTYGNSRWRATWTDADAVVDTNDPKFVREDAVVDAGLFGAKPSASAASNRAAIRGAIGAAMASGSSAAEIRIPAGTYDIHDLTLPSGGVVKNVTLRGAGPGSTILRLRDGADTGVALTIAGAPTSVSASLTSDAAFKTTTLTIGGSAVFAVGDWILLSDATKLDGGERYNLEINRVTAVSSSALTLESQTLGAYSASHGATVVKLDPATFVTVRDLTIDLSQYPTDAAGIKLDYAIGCAIVDCEVVGAKNQPFVSAAHSIFTTIEGNFIQGARSSANADTTGVVLSFGSSFNVVRGNRFMNVAASYVTLSSHCNTFVANVCRHLFDSGFNTHGSNNHGNVFVGNTIEDTPIGILVSYSGALDPPDCQTVVADNVIRNASGYGIRVESTSNADTHCVVSGNQILDGGATGIYVHQVNKVVVSGNVLTDASATGDYNIHLGGSNHCLVHGNVVSRGGIGIEVVDSDFASLQGNTLDHSATRGIGVLGAKHALVQGNTVRSAASGGDGILLKNDGAGTAPAACSITGNLVHDTPGGGQCIHLKTGTGIVVTGNQCLQPSGAAGTTGIWAESGTTYAVTQNRLVGNANAASLAGTSLSTDGLGN